MHLSSFWPNIETSYDQESISPRVSEIIIQILQKFNSILLEIKCWDQVTIFLIP